MKTRFLMLVMAAALILSGCATTAGASTSAAPIGATATPGIVNANYASALPVSSQLALGSIKLKDTPDAITAEQAATLLPLWQALQYLSAKSNPSEIEVNALIAQIQESMNPNQLQTIAGFKLTQNDVNSVMQSMGGPNGAGFGPGGAPSVNGTPVARTPGANRTGNNGGGNFGGPGGGPGGGGFPEGGALGGGAAAGAQPTVSTSIQATAQAAARSASTQKFNAGNTTYFRFVVNYLEQMVTTK